MLCAPWYALGEYLLARSPGVLAEDTDLVVAFSSCLSSAAFSALTVTFFFLLLIGVRIPVHASLLAAAMVGLGTPILGLFGMDVFGTALLCRFCGRGAAAFLPGGPFEFGYPAAAEGTKRLNTFDTPLLTGLYGFLLSPGKSVFNFCASILALAGLRWLWKLERCAASVAM